MEVHESKMGRVFRFEFEEGENFLVEISSFARKQNIREASLVVLGAILDGEIVTGFKNTHGGPWDSTLQALGRREFFGLGNLTWPVKPPKSMIRQAVSWDEPQPYPHFHLAFGPDVGEQEKKNLVGHLEKGLSYGVTVLLYELLSDSGKVEGNGESR
jgi:predicted DNA-binding protein with PD1-like motif